MEKKIMQRWAEMPQLYKVQIISYLIAGICGAIAYPLTTKLIYSAVDTSVLASRLTLSSLIGIALSFMWLNIQEKLYKWLIEFNIAECIAYSVAVGYVIVTQDYNSYILMSTIIGSTIGHIVGGGGYKLHQQITQNEQHRTDYGFFIEIVSSIGVLIGSAVAVTFDLTMGWAFITLLISLIGFQITDIYVYLKVKKSKSEDK